MVLGCLFFINDTGRSIKPNTTPKRQHTATRAPTKPHTTPKPQLQPQHQHQEPNHHITNRKPSPTDSSHLPPPTNPPLPDINSSTTKRLQQCANTTPTPIPAATPKPSSPPTAPQPLWYNAPAPGAKSGRRSRWKQTVLLAGLRKARASIGVWRWSLEVGGGVWVGGVRLRGRRGGGDCLY